MKKDIKFTLKAVNFPLANLSCMQRKKIGNFSGMFNNRQWSINRLVSKRGTRKYCHVYHKKISIWK